MALVLPATEHPVEGESLLEGRSGLLVTALQHFDVAEVAQHKSFANPLADFAINADFRGR